MWPTIIGIGILAVAGFIYWRWHSVRRGGNKVHEIILERLTPLTRVLEQGGEPDPAMIRTLAAQPENRRLLWDTLAIWGKSPLFPTEYLTWEAQAAGALAVWCWHPNEFNAVPLRMEAVASVPAEAEDGSAEIFVFQFAYGPEHSTKGETMLGVAGPYGQQFPPYNMGTAFSRGDRVGACSPEELVEWFLKLHGMSAKVGKAKSLTASA